MALCKIHFTNKDFAAKYLVSKIIEDFEENRDWVVESMKEKYKMIPRILLGEIYGTQISIHQVKPNSDWKLGDSFDISIAALDQNIMSQSNEYSIRNTEYSYISIWGRYSFFIIDKNQSIEQNAINFMHFMFREKYFYSYKWILNNYNAWFSQFTLEAKRIIDVISKNNKNVSTLISYIIFKHILKDLYKERYNMANINEIIEKDLSYLESFLSGTIFMVLSDSEIVKSFYNNIISNHGYMFDLIRSCITADEFWGDVLRVVNEIARATQEALSAYLGDNVRAVKSQLVVDAFKRFWLTRGVKPLVISVVKKYKNGDIKTIKITHFTKLFFTISDMHSLVNFTLLIISDKLSPIRPIEYTARSINAVYWRKWEEYNNFNIAIDYQVHCDKRKITALTKRIKFDNDTEYSKEKYRNEDEHVREALFEVTERTKFYIPEGLILFNILMRNTKMFIEAKNILLNLIARKNVELVSPTMIAHSAVYRDDIYLR